MYLLNYCLFALILYVPSTIFQLCRGGSSWVKTSTKLGLMCFAQGHSVVMPVRLEPATLCSRDKHSTTEPLAPLKPLYVAVSNFAGA